MNQISRRTLFKHGAAAAAAYFVPSGVLAAKGKPGANDRITVGTISCGHRVSLLVDQLPEQARMVAVCDCFLSRAEEFKAKRKANWRVYQNYHKLLESKDIDAVIIGTQEFQRVCSVSTPARPAKTFTPKSP